LEEKILLFAVKMLVFLMSCLSAGLAQETAKDAEFKAHLKWAQENLITTQKKVASLQHEESRDSSCLSKKCQLKSLQIPVLETHTETDKDLNLASDSNEKILIFVSFSMPEASLKALTQEASQGNVVLILRGLIEDSFKKTAERLKEYAQGMEINPQLFEQYAIQHTPTFVRIKDAQEQARLSGNVTLTFATQKLKEDS
jgi:conjugal transfer pilus assembly protein TrbC